jgi:hypothetical protein
VTRDAGLGEVETWTVEGRWFASISRCHEAPEVSELEEPSAEPEVLTLLRNAYRRVRR